MSQHVVPVLRIVANGGVGDGGKDGKVKLHVTLLATPYPAKEGDAGAILLSEWPSRMRDLVRPKATAPKTPEDPDPLKVRIRVKESGGAGKHGEFPMRLRDEAAYDDMAAWDAVSRVWRKVFEAKEKDDLWAYLAGDIGKALGGKRRKAGFKDGVVFSVPGQPGACEPSADDGQPPKTTVELSKDALEDDGKLRARAPVAGGPEESIVGVLSVRQADYAAREELARAMRVMVKHMHGPAAIADDARFELGGRANGDDSQAEATADIKRYGRDQAFPQYLAILQSEEIQKVRRESEALYGALHDLLFPAPNADRQSPPRAVAGRPQPGFPMIGESEIASAITLRGTERRLECSPGTFDSHDYFLWPQITQAQPAGPANPEPKAPLCAQPVPPDMRKTVDRAQAKFLALQANPILARLFGLAFDCAVDETVLRAAADNTVGDVMLHLAPDMNRQCQLASWPDFPKLPVVATAALLKRRVAAPDPKQQSKASDTNRPATVRFWPLSIFTERQGIAEADCGAYADQEDGFFISRDPGGASRYDVTALDFRHSIEAKSGDRDRGQTMLSGGLSILDRRRADQIVRDLVLLSSAQDHIGRKDWLKDWLVLHAEQLTIGRRVDVAFAKGGVDPGKIEWRSLMTRFIDYDFGDEDKALERLLRKLIPDMERKPRLHEETWFQLGARMLPLAVKTGTAPCYDVIAEEAAFLWSGAPAAIDVSMSVDEHPSDLPFSRIFDLPSRRSEPKLTIPPLRFGMPYLFRMRAVFLGGGSPGVDDIVPSGRAGAAIPYVKDGLRPRRFLRHENIGAPIMLLPRDLAERRMDMMGYEQLDAAIIRTTITREDILKPEPNGQGRPAPSRAEEIAREIQGTYLDLDRRSLPEETLRILVPPEVPAEMLERHGMLDKGKAEEVLLGGLGGVRFKPHPRPDLTGGKERRHSGFPIAITERTDGLDSDGVVDRRWYYDLDKPPVCRDATHKSGIPVFAPGKRQPAGPGETGYLPDPAVRYYSIRARRPGSDVYLDGDIHIDAYEGTSYPHVLPLAIRVKPRQGPLAGPRCIEEIAKLAPGLSFLDGDAKPGRRGCKVKLVEISLDPHEDFKLEIACLPDKDEFARIFALPETIAAQIKEGNANDWVQRLIAGDALSAQKLAGDKPPSLPFTGIAGVPVPGPKGLASIAQTLLCSMRKKWPIEEIAAVRKLRICHAVNLPTAPARWRETPKVLRPGAKPVVPPNAKHPNPWQGIEAAIEADRALDPEFSLLDRFDALLSGVIEIDLAEVDGFDIIAETVGLDGRPLDDQSRARSVLSRRSGRWPRIITKTGDTEYASPFSVYGFNIDDKGAVALPPMDAVLLSVRNLPPHGALGEPVGADNGGAILFPGASDSRKTKVALYPFFASAFNGETTLPLAVKVPGGAKDAQGRRRQLTITRPYVFSDTLARQLRLRIVTRSRHASDFATAPIYASSDRSPQTLYRRQPLISSQQSLSSPDLAEVSLPATRRPAAVDARRPELSFVMRREPAEPRGGQLRHSVCRHARARIWLGRGWYSSGEGERLGIVLWPPCYGAIAENSIGRNEVPVGQGRRMRKLDDFEDADLGEGGQFITRWGGDPTREDFIKQESFFIPPRAFDEIADPRSQCENPHNPRLVDGPVRMPLPRSAPGPRSAEKPSGGAAAKPSAYLDVSLLTYEPCFDPDREEWFVDVALRTKSAAEPFVRFGLVRYQGNAASETIQVSEPVTVMVQLLPDRTFSVTLPADCSKPGEHIAQFIVEGPAGIAVKKLGGANGESPAECASRQDELNLSKMRVSLFWERATTAMSIRTPIKGCGSFELDCVGMGEGPSASSCRWHKDVPLNLKALEQTGPGQLVAYVEEIERRMPTTYAEEPVTLEQMCDRSSFVDSGPRFSARIPFFMA